LNREFLADFQICRLHDILSRELSCGSFEIDQHLEWWKKNWQYISPQKSQTDFNAVAREEVIRHVGPHRLKKEPKVIRDQPVAVVGWTPCQHWGGDRQCANCHHTGHVAGAMMRAQELWEGNNKFVRFYTNVVLETRGQQVTQQIFDDIVSGVWHRVTKVIDDFSDPGNGTQRRAWLKQQVEWVVADYFRDSMRDKRDSRREESFDELVRKLSA
jgi:hypothetical protein